MLFGTFIEESASKLAYHLWKLHHATEPKLFVPLPEAGHSDITVAEPHTYTSAIKEFIASLHWHRPWCYTNRPVVSGADRTENIRGT